MARARNIKPGFFANEELVELPFATRLLFIGLWTIADRDGRMEDKPKRIKMILFPADDFDIDEALNALQSSGFVLRYEIAGAKYIQVLAFEKHQNPHRDEKASTFPAPCLHGANTVPVPNQKGGNRADSLSLIPDSLIPDSLTADVPPADVLPVADLFPAEPPAAKVVASIRADYPDHFEIAWAAYPKRPGMNKKDSYKAYAARVKSGHDPTEILAGVQRYAKFCTGTGKDNTEFIKQPATFFGPNEHFKQDWAFVPQPVKGSQGSKNGSLTTQNYRAGVAPNGAF